MSSTPRQPNFVYILADDLGYADLGCMGACDSHNQPANISPNLDQLAAEGTRYTHGYANSAVCSPTRFALMTARWQYRLRGAAEEPIANAFGDKVIGLPPSHPTLASMLKEVGYDTTLVGKWHLGYPPHFGPRQSGYHAFYGVLSGGVDYFAHTAPRGGKDFWENETSIDPDGYLTDLLTAKAVETIDKQSADRPFLLSLHYSAPHWPWLTRDDRQESLRTATNGIHTDGGSVEKYQRMIHHMDEGIGLVLDALQRRAFDDNTLVVFTSDNGGERFSNNWPFVGQKMDLMEGGIRVPLLARYPRSMPAGQVSSTQSLTMDWTATMLALAGAKPSADYALDGVDLSPSFANTAWNRPGNLAWRMKHLGQRAYIERVDGVDWKYLHINGIDYLFNLNEDSRERANLAKRIPDRLAIFKAKWEAWNATMPPIPEDAQARMPYSKQDMP